MSVHRSALVAFAALVLPAAPLAAQQEGGAQLPDSVRELVQEFQGLRQRLDSVQRLTMEQNPRLQERQQDVESFVNEIMVDQHPGIEAKMDRLPELQQSLVEARQAGDTAQLRSVVQEGQQLQAELQQARMETLQDDSVQERVSTLREDLMTAMVEVDPGIGDVMDRLEVLARRLQAIQQGG